MKSIYIVLSQSGTLFSKAIKKYTRDPYNHASISFDRSLRIMYSFGRRRRYNLLNCGFVRESFDRGVFSCFPNANCCVIEIPVTRAKYDTMHEVVNSFCNNYYNYHYNLIGVVSYMLGIGFSRKDHYFCSQFVSYVLNIGGVYSFKPELTKPMDFLKIPNAKVVFEGNIHRYKSEVYGFSKLVS